MLAAPVTVTYPDSSLPLLSDPAGWSDPANLNVEIPLVVVPNPTTLALTSKLFTLSFSIWNLIKSFII